MNLELDIDLSDLANAISRQPMGDIFQLIVDTDQAHGDWELTRKLRDHFVSEMKQFEEGES